MRAFGESLVAYRPPIDTRSVSEMRQIPPNGFPEKALNFLTPHQKWGIHSTYSENLLIADALSRWTDCLDQRNRCPRTDHCR
ncbi:respiratory nitrate reductase 2 alpha chain [Escherichia coli]|uniref:Respiratory nitrate reductase 2 alpha chain n=1 Tax=Escherichia coli TaxID=562 RepID=A0A377A0W1_ECOLX|nr:respiratory nitrate reductase 2 alpha chain [Escherichia coli]